MSTTQQQPAVSLLISQVQFAHTALDGTLEGVTAEIATAKSAGLARSIGSYYAHILISEDLVINSMLQQQAPLFAAAWRDRTGFDGPAPA